jgi:hypothetical protein
MRKKPRFNLNFCLAIGFLTSVVIAFTDLRPLALYIVIPAIPIWFFIAWLKDDRVDAANEHDLSFLLASFGTGFLGLVYLVSLTIDLLTHDNKIVRSVAMLVSMAPIILIFVLWFGRNKLARKRSNLKAKRHTRDSEKK